MVLNVIFVVAFDLDVAGVALATVISQVLSAALVVIALIRRTDACRLKLPQLKIYGAQLRKLIVIGVPSGIQGCTFSLSNVNLALVLICSGLDKMSLYIKPTNAGTWSLSKNTFCVV